MDNKYFTPSIEDIRVGYECGWYRNNIMGWEKFIIGNNAIGEYSEWSQFEQLDLDRIRVPYLTKEQIEAEGWVFKQKRKNHWLQEELLYTKKHSDRAKGIMDGFEREWTLFVPESILGNNLIGNIIIQLEIMGGFMGIHKTSTIWDGRIKDINTFRYICKLLNIN